MPHVIEKAPTGRAKCRGCGEKIAGGKLRFGESLPNPFAEGETLHWFHPECAAMKRPEPFLEAIAASAPAADAAPVDAVAAEPLPDKDRLEALARAGAEHPRLPRVSGAERDPSGRAQCRHCREKIDKGAWRIQLVFWEEGRFSPAGSLHVPCASGYFGTAAILDRVRRFSPGLGDAELREIESELQKPSPPAAEPPPRAAPEAGS